MNYKIVTKKKWKWNGLLPKNEVVRVFVVDDLTGQIVGSAYYDRYHLMWELDRIQINVPGDTWTKRYIGHIEAAYAIIDLLTAPQHVVEPKLEEEQEPALLPIKKKRKK